MTRGEGSIEPRQFFRDVEGIESFCIAIARKSKAMSTCETAPRSRGGVVFRNE